MVLSACGALSLCFSACGPDAEQSDSVQSKSQRITADPWAAGVTYNVGDLVSFGGSVYRVVQSHTSQPGWDPVAVPALWAFEALDSGSPSADPTTPPASGLTLAYVAGVANCDESPESCCEVGTQITALTEGPDTLYSTSPNQCLITLGGADTVFLQSTGPSSLILGTGDDTAMDGPGDDFIWAGPGRDTINGHGGTNLFFAGWGDDVIMAANGDNTVVPGPGIDTVNLGTGNDVVHIFDLCEVGPGEILAGGTGEDTLYTPVPLSELQDLGVVVSSFETIIVREAPCLSQCADHSTCGCISGDFDGDEVADCQDECWQDPNKIEAGICGCSEPETDTDGDSFPDCEDECPLDPGVQFKGTCGCPSDPTAQGETCYDGVCPGANTCSSGMCGNPNECRPDPSCNLRYVPSTNKYYWLCDDLVTWEQASAKCSASRGSRLAAVRSATDNSLLAGSTDSPLWIGANDRTTEGEWYWRSYSSDEGTRIWTGGPSGNTYFGAFNAFATPPSANGSCAYLNSGGSWSVAGCGETRGYICEVSIDRILVDDGPRTRPLDPEDISGTAPFNPDPWDDDDDDDIYIPCENESDVFGSLSQEDVARILGECQACQEAGTSDCSAVCVGPAAPPTAGDSCDPLPGDAHDLYTGCREGDLVLPEQTCDEAADCRLDLADPLQFCAGGCPAGQRCVGMFCAIEKICSWDYPGATSTSPGKCMTPTPPEDCGPFEDLPEACSETFLCDVTYTNSAPTLQGDLEGGEFIPEDHFAEPTEETKGEYPAEPCTGCGNLGFDHPWCSVDMTDGLPEQQPVDPEKSGDTGEGLVRFNFDPMFSFAHEASIGPFGLPEVYVKAQAGVVAEAQLGFAGSPKFSIIEALGDLRASHCGAYGNATLKLLGKNFIDGFGGTEPAVTLPFSFPSDYVDPEELDCTGDDCPQSECERLYGEILETANRTEKALRDAVELLRIYRARGEDASLDNLPEDFCRLVAESPPRGFPVGDCSESGFTESPEDTLIRFIRYYEQSLTGFTGDSQGAKSVLDLAHELSSSFSAVDQSFALTDIGENEEATILSTQFFIGPIPVFLEIGATLDWGVTLDAKLELSANQFVADGLFSPEDTSSQIAYAGLDGTPYASAGMYIFAGVGFGVPGFKVQLGMEGTLKLGTVHVPAYAGAGLWLGSQTDETQPGVDIAPFWASDTGGTPWVIPPKVYTARVGYLAGLGVNVRDILSGDIGAKLKLRVAFFSKTWRKRLFTFAGICPATYSGSNLNPIPECDFPIFEVGGVADEGSHPWGSVRMPLNFPRLTPPVKGTYVASPAGTPIDDLGARANEFFYDSQCQCIEEGEIAEEPDEQCFRNDDCCGDGLVCFTHASGDREGDRECTQCIPEADERGCNQDSDCCMPTRTSNKHDNLRSPFCAATKSLGCQSGMCGSPCFSDGDCRQDGLPDGDEFTCHVGACALMAGIHDLCDVVR